MYYVVPGAAGFIGSRLVAALNRRGIADIIAVDNLPAGGELPHPTGMRIRDYLRHDEFLERFDGALEAVFHEGACTNTMVHDRRLMMESNFEFSRRLLDRCQSARVPLIYASSAAVYGGSGGVREEPPGERPPRPAGARGGVGHLQLRPRPRAELQRARRRRDQRRARHAPCAARAGGEGADRVHPFSRGADGEITDRHAGGPEPP